jgi:hypothetical protein
MDQCDVQSLVLSEPCPTGSVGPTDSSAPHSHTGFALRSPVSHKNPGAVSNSRPCRSNRQGPTSSSTRVRSAERLPHNEPEPWSAQRNCNRRVVQLVGHSEASPHITLSKLTKSTKKLS